MQLTHRLESALKAKGCSCSFFHMLYTSAESAGGSVRKCEEVGACRLHPISTRAAIIYDHSEFVCWTVNWLSFVNLKHHRFKTDRRKGNIWNPSVFVVLRVGVTFVSVRAH